ncbi:hypothetical protein GIB67_037785 [Kingdonia uniflora]|uniref:Inositol-pentakisphosphate 2-kinase n=1 Tax=Kingdonia uniflora TaxID=39325 RepID=A0A7J7LV40_9MAGN|nr:hypothetical protein GIB67_037785 [Kingdonia uniflora]
MNYEEHRVVDKTCTLECGGSEINRKTSDSMELVLEGSDVGIWVYKGKGAQTLFSVVMTDQILILLERQFLEAVKNNILCQGPAWRVNASKVNPLYDSVLLISDHSIFPDGIINVAPCISVEIKPKCGFLQNSKFIAEANAVKRTISRFQMYQVLKLHQGEISCVSDYDPLDLFSGSIRKINKAIKELFTMPQNNFCIFLNGYLISEGLAGIDSTRSVANGKFEDTLEGIIRADRGFRLNSFLYLVAETILISKVLGKLLDAQKLDLIDIEGVIHAYYNVIFQYYKICGEWGDSKVSKRCPSLYSLSLEDNLKIVRDYMIATTTKDCSLMLSFKPKMDEDQMSLHNTVYLESMSLQNTVCLEPINQRFDYKAYFIDLDMKPLKKMVHYYEQNQKIVSCYTPKEKMKYEPPNLVNRNEY